MSPHLEQRALIRGVARVWRVGGEGGAAEVVGTAMLVAPRHLITCAHVAAVALGHAADADAPPTGPLWVDLPALAPGRLLRAAFEVWLPRRPRPGGAYDIAGLVLVDDPPEGAESVPLVVAEGVWEQPCRVFGFPAGRPDGSYGAGSVRDVLANGWVMLRGGPEAREFTRPGYSGGPVYGDSGVLGMLTEGDRDQRVREAVMIPTETLLAAWPALGGRLRVNPFPGLAPFTADQAHLYFGRRRAAAELLDELRRPPHVRVLAGASGGGKSSLLQAGLAQVGGDTWQVLRITPGSRPHDALARALLLHARPDLGPSEQLRETARLRELMAGSGGGLADALLEFLAPPTVGRRLLALDQVEELVSRVGWSADGDGDAVGHPARADGSAMPDAGRLRADAVSFLDGLLAALADPRLQGRLALLLAVRTDHLDALLAAPALAALHARTPLVRYLGPVEDLREVITGPLGQAGTVRVEAGLVDRLIDDVAGQPNPLPLLAFTLRELWRRQHAGQLTHAAYDALGGVASALAGFAQACYEELDLDDRRRARGALVQLARPLEGPSYVRRVAPLAAFAEPERAVLERLADRRLVVFDTDAAGEPCAAVVHEALFEHWPALRGWLDETWAFRRWQEGLRSAIVEWRALGEDPVALPRGALLAQAERFLLSHGEALSADERGFLGKAIDHRDEDARRERVRAQRERRAQRLLVGVLGGALTMVLTLAGVALWAWDRAAGAETAARERAEAVARANDRLAAVALDLERSLGGASEALAAQLGAHALLAVRGADGASADPALASLLAAQAARLQPGSVSHDALLRVLQAHPRFAERLPIVATALAVHADRGVLAGTENGEVAWFPSAGEAVRAHGHHGRVTAVAVGAAAAVAASAGDDGRVRLWSLPSLAPRGEPWPAHELPTRAITLSADGRWLATVGIEGTIRVWELSTRALAATIARGAVVAAVAPGMDPGSEPWRDAGIPVGRAATAVDRVAERAHAGWLGALAFGPASAWLAWADADGRVVFADAGSGWSSVAVADLGGEIRALVAQPDDSGVLVAVGGGELVRVGPGGVATRMPFGVHPGTITGLALSADGAEAIVLDALGSAYVLDASDGEPRAEPLRGLGPMHWFAAPYPDGFVTAAGDGSVTRWFRTAPDPLVRRLGQRDVLPAALSVAADGRVAVGWHDGALQVISAGLEGPSVLRLAAHGDAIHALHVEAPTGTLLSAARDGRLVRSSLSDLQPIGAPLWAHREPLWSIVPAAAGRGVWVGGVQGVAQRWPDDGRVPAERLELRTGLLWTPAPEVHEAESGDLRAVRIRYDVTVTRHGARVWSSTDAPGGDVHAIAFDARGERFLAQRDAHLEVREVEGFALLARVPAPAHEAFAIDPSGRWLAVVNREGRPQLFEAATLRPVGAPLAASAARAHRLAFSPDGRTLVVASERGEIDAWDLDAEAWLARACTRAVGAEAGGAWAAALQTLGVESACGVHSPTGGAS